jgi:hypothetical protein
LSTNDPPRNFSLDVAARLKAAIGGPPAYMRRLRAIEDAEEHIVRSLAELCAKAVSTGDDPRECAVRDAPQEALERLRGLIAKHNRFYPIEANLPLSPRTGELMSKDGEPWRPLPFPSLEDLVARAMTRL